uniref:C-type lectin domain-containing protein n=1 Tax=Nippostrongylus brasiliensis TaxID=27835 RepID=A0A0N4YHR6_NIPBR
LSYSHRRTAITFCHETTLVITRASGSPCKRRLKTPDRLRSAFRGNPKPCPKDWLGFRESCYYMEPTKLNRNEAEEACFKKEAALFVADSGEEFVKNGRQQDSPRRVELDRSHSAQWQQLARLDCDWLSTPFSSQANGWSQETICAAYHGAEAYSIANVYFYPCSSLCFSICERNSTLVK